jgi:hypothetical protein
VLFFIELASRRVHLAGSSQNPSGAWVAQQACNLAWSFDERASLRFLIHDRDSKFTDVFDEVFRSEEIEVIPNALQGAAGECVRRGVRNDSSTSASPSSSMFVKCRQKGGRDDSGFTGDLTQAQAAETRALEQQQRRLEQVRGRSSACIPAGALSARPHWTSGDAGGTSIAFRKHALSSWFGLSDIARLERLTSDRC